MADKYVYKDHSTGRDRERELTVVSAGAGDAGKGVALGTGGTLDPSVMPPGVTADTQSITASEDLAAGDWVNIHNSSGIKVRKADATTEGKEAMGFVLAAATTGNAAAVYREGYNTALTGLTLAADYFLSAATPGAATATPPSAAGNVVQFLGVATSATTIRFESTRGVTLA